MLSWTKRDTQRINNRLALPRSTTQTSGHRRGNSSKPMVHARPSSPLTPTLTLTRRATSRRRFSQTTTEPKQHDSVCLPKEASLNKTTDHITITSRDGHCLQYHESRFRWVLHYTSVDRVKSEHNRRLFIILTNCTDDDECGDGCRCRYLNNPNLQITVCHKLNIRLVGSEHSKPTNGGYIFAHTQ